MLESSSEVRSTLRDDFSLFVACYIKLFKQIFELVYQAHGLFTLPGHVSHKNVKLTRPCDVTVFKLQNEILSFLLLYPVDSVKVRNLAVIVFVLNDFIGTFLILDHLIFLFVLKSNFLYF